MQTIEKPEGYYVQYREEMIKYIPENAKTILDVGCSEGFFGAELKKKGAIVWGIEIEDGPANAAVKRLDKVIINTVEGAIDQLPDAYFDCIVFNDVLEHLLDPDAVLFTLKNKLTVNGVIVTSVPNVRYWKNLRKLLYKRDWKYEPNGILDRTHFRFFTKISIVRMFNDVGYDVLKIEGINGTKSIRFDFFNAMFLFKAGDARYLQFACVAKPTR